MKRTIYIVTTSVLSLFMPCQSFAQTFQEKYFKDGIYSFDDLGRIAQSELFTTYKSGFGLGIYDEMRQTNNVIDSTGKFTTKYELFHRGVRVEGSLMNVIGEKGIVRYANGFLLTGLNADIDNVITEQEAIEAAIIFIDANLYAWEDSLMEAEIKEENDSNATHYPQRAELIIAKRRGENYSHVDSNYQLCYKVTIHSLDPAELTDVYVNANTGSVFTTHDPRTYDYATEGTLWTWYDGYHSNIRTMHCGNCSNYWLHDDGRKIYTTKDGKNWDAKGPYNKDGNNHWVDDNQKTAASAHWGVQRSWEYYGNRHGRWGTDWNSRRVHIQTQASSTIAGSTANAVYTSGTYQDNIYITSDGTYPGPSSPGAGYSVASLDWMGHEFTHGMIKASSELGVLGDFEAKALNEGYADIFGNRIERYTLTPSEWDWSWAEGTGFITRHLDNPHNDVPFASPEIYLETNYWDTDKYHNAGGVIRKWYYLVVEGGTFNGNVISPLGIEIADDIAYNTFNWWLWSTISYPEAARETINATAYMYGYCSHEYKQVVKAMRAVGFNFPYPWCININIAGPQVIQGGIRGFMVNPDKPKWNVNLNDIGDKMGIYVWNMPSSWHVTINNNEITLDSVDNYNSQQLSVTYRTDSTEHTDTIVVHFSDIEWQPTNYMPAERMAKPFEEEMSAIKDVILFPNPANDIVTINVNNFKGKAQVEVYDISGRLIKQQALTTPYIDLDISGLHNGVYIIKTLSNEVVSSQKLTVLH